MLHGAFHHLKAGKRRRKENLLSEDIKHIQYFKIKSIENTCSNVYTGQTLIRTRRNVHNTTHRTKLEKYIEKEVCLKHLPRVSDATWLHI